VSNETSHKHHYVPVFYLKRWAVSADRQMCEYQRVRLDKITSRRIAPEATGYKVDIYAAEGAQYEIESTPLRLLDTLASFVLEALERGVDTLNDQMRSDWTRFILSLRFRTRERVAVLKEDLTEVANVCTGVQTGLAAPQKAALQLLAEVIDNDRGQARSFAT
jgi:hypothetical protein